VSAWALFGILEVPPPSPAPAPRLHVPLPGARVECGVIPGLPPLKFVAAGAEHALLSDGQRVWVVGRTVNERGTIVVEAPWDAPVVGVQGVCVLFVCLFMTCV